MDIQEQINSLMFGYFIVIIIWFILNCWISNQFIKTIKLENKSIWESIGSPTLFKKNLTLYKFIFSKKIESLSEKLKLLGKLMRYMSYFGVIIVVLLIISSIVLL